MGLARAGVPIIRDGGERRPGLPRVGRLTGGAAGRPDDPPDDSPAHQLGWGEPQPGGHSRDVFGT
jgi:hypothetical protein